MALLAVVPATLAAPARAQGVDAWGSHTQWLSLRAGYAKAAAKYSANGFAGYGFSYSRFLSNKWALEAAVQHDLLGRFGAASEIEVPFTVGLTRHFKWATPARPYLGFGTGVFFHKTYRTGADASEVRKGAFVSMGVNALISDRSLLGLDIRPALEFDALSDNPVFVSDQSSVVHWSVKLNYSRFF